MSTAYTSPYRPIWFHYPDVLKPYRITFNSYAASVIAVSTGFPLDSVKARLQTYKYKSNWHCIVDTYKNEGIGGFYRGLTLPLVSSSIIRAWALSLYASTKPLAADFWNRFYDVEGQSKGTFDSVLRGAPVSFTAGVVGGISTSVMSCPFELCKLGSQIELVMKRRSLELQSVAQAGKSHAKPPTPPASIKPLGVRQIATKLVSAGGPLALYSGFRYQLMRDVIGTGIYFGVYDSIKTAVGLYFFNTKETHPVSVAVAGGLSGGFSWVFVYPLDTLKSRHQRDVMARILSGNKAPEPVAAPTTATPVAPASAASTASSIGKGLLSSKGMYRGLGISLIRTSILGTTMFSTYEFLMSVTD